MTGWKQPVRIKVEINEGVETMSVDEINDGMETTSADESRNKRRGEERNPQTM
jgi:hypothetical protein